MGVFARHHQAPAVGGRVEAERPERQGNFCRPAIFRQHAVGVPDDVPGIHGRLSIPDQALGAGTKGIDVEPEAGRAGVERVNIEAEHVVPPDFAVALQHRRQDRLWHVVLCIDADIKIVFVIGEIDARLDAGRADIRFHLVELRHLGRLRPHGLIQLAIDDRGFVRVDPHRADRGLIGGEILPVHS